MEYKLQIRSDCDRSLKIDNVQILTYSASRLERIAPKANIAGDVLLSGKKAKPQETEPTVVLGERRFPVREPKKPNRLTQQTKGYVAVGENDYLRLYRSRFPFLIALLSLLLLAAVGAALIVTVFSVDNPPVAVSNPLPVIDPNAKLVDPTDKPRPEYPDGSGSVEISMKPTASLHLASGKIEMGYTNPANSSHDAVLQLYVVTHDADGAEQEYRIARSGRIPQGNQLESMALSADRSLFGGEGVYEAKYKVSFYDPATGEKALMDSELTSITLKVYAQ